MESPGQPFADIFAPLTPPYDVIAADPPWRYKAYSPKGDGRSPKRHYRTMPLHLIKALPVQDLAARDCHLLLWTTQPHLLQSIEVMKAWGFRYSSIFLHWFKLNPLAGPAYSWGPKSFHIGTGHTTRKNVETVLLGRRGSPRRIANDVPDHVIARVREHSRKPDEFYDAADRYAAGRRCDLFSRESRPGWDAWGDEAGKFDALLENEKGLIRGAD